jgi:hypothetical protein
MKIEKITTRRVRVDDDFYVDITPSASFEGLHDFVLRKIGSASYCYMFGCAVSNEIEMADMALANADDYIDLFDEESGDDQ